MNPESPAEYLLIEEVMQSAHKARAALRGLSPGMFIKMIRRRIGMSQEVLAKRANVPQSTISRLERWEKEVSQSTLQKVLVALSCDLVITPVLQMPIETIRQRQAKRVAEEQVQYLKGTMYLEDQLPDERFLEELLKQEEKNLLSGPNSKLWDVHD